MKAVAGGEGCVTPIAAASDDEKKWNTTGSSFASSANCPYLVHLSCILLNQVVENGHSYVIQKGIADAPKRYFKQISPAPHSKGSHQTFCLQQFFPSIDCSTAHELHIHFFGRLKRETVVY